jgi:hypothetical protein
MQSFDLRGHLQYAMVRIMPYRAQRRPSLPDRPLPSDPPTEIAAAPRPWLSRAAGECAFPVDGEGWTTRACCNTCPGAAYCAAHLARMFRPL